jgi:hypothetical protein
MTARDADVIELFTTEGLLPVLKYRPHVRALGE